MKALKIYKALGKKKGMANQYGNLGNIHQTRGDLEKACESWRKSLDLFSDIGAKDMIQQVSGWLAEACNADCPQGPSSDVM